MIDLTTKQYHQHNISCILYRPSALFKAQQTLIISSENFQECKHPQKGLFRIPFQKIISLLIRTMAKPMLTLAKKKHTENKEQIFNQILNGFFIWFGRRYHRLEHWINYKIVKSTKHKTIKELKEQIALQKGIEGLYEIFFYSIVIGIPLYEMHKASVAAEQKQNKLNEQIGKMEQNLNQMISQLNQINQEEEKIKQRHEQLRIQTHTFKINLGVQGLNSSQKASQDGNGNRSEEKGKGESQLKKTVAEKEFNTQTSKADYLK